MKNLAVLFLLAALPLGSTTGFAIPLVSPVGRDRPVFQSTKSEDCSSRAPAAGSGVGRRETLTGTAALFSLPLLKELLSETKGLPVAFPGGAAAVSASLLAGDTIVRNLWLSRLTYPVLIVALQSGLFEALRQRSLTKDELGSRLTPPVDGQGRFMEAMAAVLCSLELLQLGDDQRVSLTAPARHVMLQDSPYYWGHQLLAADGMTASLRQAMHRDGRTTPRAAFQAHSDAAVDSFIDSMDSHSSVTAHATAQALAPVLGAAASRPVHHLLDMAGGSGCFTLALHKVMGVKMTLADLPLVVERFRKHNPWAGVEVVAADLFDAATWPKEPDAHLMANVLHDWGPDQVSQILTTSYQTLSTHHGSQGCLVLVEQLLQDNYKGPLPVALASVSMLLGDWRSGKQYTYRELESSLRKAGFSRVERGPPCGGFHTAVIAHV